MELRRKWFCILVSAGLFFSDVSLSENLHEIQYDGFTIWEDCDRRGPELFEYWASKDTGTFPRKQSFSLDKDVDTDCQQWSADTYSSQYDRGHLVPANHLDHTKTGITQSNFMTNILPQAKGMNRGAWLRTEEIIECYRDDVDLHVVGGVVWGRNTHDDHFIQSHGVETPDYFWKIVESAEGDYLIWYIPNDPKARKNNLDDYLISFSELRQLTGLSKTRLQSLFGITLSIPKSDYHSKPEHSWPYHSGCSKRNS